MPNGTLRDTCILSLKLALATLFSQRESFVRNGQAVVR